MREEPCFLRGEGLKKSAFTKRCGGRIPVLCGNLWDNDIFYDSKNSPFSPMLTSLALHEWERFQCFCCR